MHTSDILAVALTVLCVLGLVLYRLLWAGSQLAAAAGLGRFPRFPARLRRWLFGEHEPISTQQRH
jgi:hypothetical protein